MRNFKAVVWTIFCSLLLSTFAFADPSQEESNQETSSYNRPVAAMAATGSLVGLAILAKNSGAVVSAVATNIIAIAIGSVTLFVSSVVWETAAKKITNDDNTPYKFSHLLVQARENAIKPAWESIGYGMAMYFDMCKSVLDDTVIVGREYLDAFAVTPIQSLKLGSDTYCDAHGLDKTNALIGESVIIASDLALFAFLASYASKSPKNLKTTPVKKIR